MDFQQLAARVRVLEDIEAIRQLKARYLACCDHKDPAGMRACFVDGPMHIDYGALGIFDTADAVVKLFTDIACHEHMVELHHGVNPQIEILDEHRARGRWGLHYALINTQARTFTRLAGDYADEYARGEGGWKISRTRFVATSTLVLELGAGHMQALFAGRAPPLA